MEVDRKLAMEDCITIVMATYNGDRYLEEQLQSLSLQTIRPHKLVVSDNESSDNTVRILTDFSKHNNIELILDVHKAPNASPIVCALDNFMNAIRHADGDYFFFCDQDDYWLPNKIERCLSRIKELEEASGKDLPILVACHSATTDEKLNELASSGFHKARITSKSCEIGSVLAGGVFLGCTMSFNAALQELLCQGTVVPDMWMHDIWAATIAASCGKFDTITEVLQYYRIHGSNTYASDIRVRNSLLKELVKQQSLLMQEHDYMRMRTRRAELALMLLGHKMRSDALPTVKAFANLYSYNKLKRMSILIKYGILREEPIAMLRELLSV